jgi:hypothetical protein
LRVEPSARVKSKDARLMREGYWTKEQREIYLNDVSAILLTA